MSRDVVDGDVVRWDLSTPGQAKAYFTASDDPGDAGDIPYSQGPGLPFVMAPPPTGVNGGGIFERFDASGTWNKPTADPDSIVCIRGWGAAGSGARTLASGAMGGGGGGGFVEKWMRLSDLGSSETVTIGVGGAPQTGTGNGNNGGNSTFGAHVTAYGGRGGTNAVGGGGGGPLGVGSGSTPGIPLIYDGAASQGQGGDSSGAARPAMWHGGGGGWGGFDAGASVWGGAGGGGANSTTGYPGGVSINGGNGGSGGANGSNGTSGAQPGGGGGAAEPVGGAQSGAGADGRFDIWIFPPQA
jgi:hypothetical protein